MVVWQESDLSPELRKRIEKQEAIQRHTQPTKSARKSKYGNVKTIIDNITFDSKREADRYYELKWLLIKGEIAKLECQVKFEIQSKFTDSQGVKHLPISYIADFCYMEKGKYIVEDVKGKKTEVYRIKKKLLLFKYPEIIFREVY